MFGDFELLEPGVIEPQHWRPELEPAEKNHEAELDDLGACGVARER
ncbi:SAM-dependent methyltransferase [Actinomadura sp. CNU-125]|nr:SAM-dependent methyltransferase [Actinomadura sp. CNU-125]